MSDIIQSTLVEMRMGGGNYLADFYLLRDYRDEDIFDLNAPYQRGSVWSVEQRQNLIKSLLMGLPVGNIIFSELPYKDGGATYRIVDGKQRIEALRAFFADEFSVPVEWFDSRDFVNPEAREIEGLEVFASYLSDRGRRKIENAQLQGLKFNAEVEVTENLDYDDSLVDQHGKVKKGHENDPNRKRWNHRPRSDEEILRAEAELYLLINFGGVEQTDADRERATEVAGR